ncbi:MULTISPECIES: hypothetical protein [Sphingobium]|uniref:hypothetical protein n=1 Tax=Sphingobium TaxID=165695 RepID=UPI000818BA11|nr:MULTISPECIES: hypothetical protein [Sphingobium]WDA38616.1 hypothetical protein PO876_10770 [Sphingobium sp. YC-XJ3]
MVSFLFDRGLYRADFSASVNKRRVMFYEGRAHSVAQIGVSFTANQGGVSRDSKQLVRDLAAVPELSANGRLFAWHRRAGR